MDDRGIYYSGGGTVADFAVGPLSFQSSDSWLALWPVLPINIYDVPRRLGLDNAVLRLSTRLKGAPVELRLRVQPR